MIISHSNKFIFLHGRKTAGSSIGIALMRYLESGDIARGYITGGLSEGVLPPDWNRSLWHLRPFDLLCPQPRVQAYRRFVKKQHGITSTHMNAKEIKYHLGEECWSEYFKFTFERNPYDRIVSFYYWRIQGLGNPPSFAEFVDALCDGDLDFLGRYNLDNFSNLPFYAIDGEVAVDFVGQYDRLNEDLAFVFDRLGIGRNIQLPKNKSGIRPPAATYEKISSKEMTVRLSKLFEKEMALFGYSGPSGFLT